MSNQGMASTELGAASSSLEPGAESWSTRVGSLLSSVPNSYSDELAPAAAPSPVSGQDAAGLKAADVLGYWADRAPVMAAIPGASAHQDPLSAPISIEPDTTPLSHTEEPSQTTQFHRHVDAGGEVHSAAETLAPAWKPKEQKLLEGKKPPDAGNGENTGKDSKSVSTLAPKGKGSPTWTRSGSMFEKTVERTTTDRSKPARLRESSIKEKQSRGYNSEKKELSLKQATTEKAVVKAKDGRLLVQDKAEQSSALSFNPTTLSPGVERSKFKTTLDQEKTGRSYKLGGSLQDGSGSFSRSTLNNGNGYTSSLSYDKDGVRGGLTRDRVRGDTSTSMGGSLGSEGVALSLSRKNEKTGGNGSLTVDLKRDETKIAGNIGSSGASFGASYDNVHNRVATEDADENLKSTRSDETDITGSVSAKAVGGSLGHRDGRLLSLSSKKPADWDKLSAAEREQRKKEHQGELAKLGPVEQLDLLSLKDESEIDFTNYSGWHAGVNGRYSVATASANGETTTAHQTKIAKKGDTLKVSVARQEGKAGDIGVGALGASVSVNGSEANSKSFEFEVDSRDSKAMESMQAFLKTGLLPGADQTKGRGSAVAAQKFHAARSECEACQQQLQELQKGNGSTAGNLDAMQQLSRRLEHAQAELERNRDFLNDQWKEQSQVGTAVMPGVTASTKTTTSSTSSGFNVKVPLLGSFGPKESITNTREEFADKQSNPQETVTHFRQKSDWLGAKEYEAEVKSSSDASKEQLKMTLDYPVGDGEIAPVYGTKQRDFSTAYLGKFWSENIKDPSKKLPLKMGISLDGSQMQSVSAALNDPKSELAQRTWTDCGRKLRGYLIDKLDSPPTYEQAALRNSIDPKVRDSLGQVNSADDFRKLAPHMQMLYVAYLTRASLTGKQNEVIGNKFNTLAPITLMSDPHLRAEATQDFLEQTTVRDLNAGKNSGAEFLKLLKQVEGSDPAAHAKIQQGVHIHLKQEGVDSRLGKKEAELAKELADASGRMSRHWYGVKYANPDYETTLNVLQALRHSHGQKAMEAAISNANIDVVATYQALKSDPLKQQMYKDLILTTELRSQLPPN